MVAGALVLHLLAVTPPYSLQKLKALVDPALSATACTTTSQHEAGQLQQHVDRLTEALSSTSLCSILAQLQEVPCDPVSYTHLTLPTKA